MRRVGITGAGVVSPIGSDLDTFFGALEAGRNGIRRIEGFDASSFEVKVAGEVRDLDRDALFEAFPDARGFFDRKVAIGLAAAKQALESSGIHGADLEGLGVVSGVSLEVMDLGLLVRREARRVDLAAFTRRVRESGLPPQTPLDAVNGILCRTYGLRGPSFVIASACASGVQSIGQGLRAIRRGDADAFLCGAFDAMVHPLGIGGFWLLGALSTNPDPDSAMRPFDARRNGTVLGEGAGYVVLEELGRARARGARILAEVSGYGSSSDAYKPTAPDPDGRGAVEAMRRAIRDAGLGPGDIGYVSAHGTSTPLNDEVETLALKEVFGPRAREVPVSAVKSMIGHLIAASGAAEAIAALMAFQRGRIPPTIHYEHPDPRCDLDYVPNISRPWSGEAVLVNCFGFGGQNASMVMRRYRA